MCSNGDIIILWKKRIRTTFFSFLSFCFFLSPVFLTQIGADGRRSQIFLALSTAADFRDHLSTFSDYYASLGPPNPDNVPEDGKLKSEMMIKDNRRYYLDLKENARGRFLRVSVVVFLVFRLQQETFYVGITNNYSWWSSIPNSYSGSRNDRVSWCINWFIRRVWN